MDIKTKTQKIIKVGNSFAITLDSGFIEASGMNAQTPVTVKYNAAGPSVEIMVRDAAPVSYSTSSPSTTKQKQQKLASEITPEFQEWVKKTLKEDAEAMKELANL